MLKKGMLWIPSDIFNFSVKHRQTEFWVAGVYQKEIWEAVDKWVSRNC